jgi:carboxyl-terminal processing protease
MKFAVVSLLSLTLTACGLTGGKKLSDVYSADQTQEVFEDAYFHIQQRFVEPVTADALALAGLAKLSAVDGQLSVVPRGNSVVLLNNSIVFETYARPPARDSEAWASLTADIVDQSRLLSSVAAKAKPDEIYDALMGGVISKLDRYSRYENPRIASLQRATRNGFGGIGATIQTEDGQTAIINVLPGMPAALAGLERNDKITHIDGVSIAGLSPLAVILRLRGKAGSPVELDIVRAKPPLRLKRVIIRTHITVPTVVGQIENGIAIVEVRGFAKTTADDLEREVERLERDNGVQLSGLVLDLRDNPGGLFDQALRIADLFLDGGLIVKTKGRNPASTNSFSADSYEIAQNVPMAIVLNGRSASASEVVAAALQGRGRAIVVGTTTFGKGSIQSIKDMPNNGDLVITWSRIYAPTGYLLEGLGIMPNVCTTGSGRGDPVDDLTLGQQRIRKQFGDWNRYDSLDSKLAKTLRSICPTGIERPGSDITLASQILRSPATYQLALSPALRTIAVRQVPARGADHS